ncbi:ribose transport system permease protein [Andreprevotia lacus DSM 23236]|jgi:ribose transport system permease protein|uniref:Ribose transport system permease protein n=1 Tax=Andreprevotia lacus DSM 23236 TaxID=1121001 RepID=A0A1W1X3P8_9NEIS|nr:ribose ABC transporter permease [Andreprevotia lacus]SMC18450.1 ribose transport system permease protein [Andreprevotia lacus DSM 23236]
MSTHAISDTAQAAGAKRHGNLVGHLFNRLGMLPVLIVLYLVFYGLTVYFSADGTSNFMTADNTMNILRQVAINLVLACGMTFVILTAGIDLSVGSMLAVSAVLGMLVSLPGHAPALAIPTFLIAGLVMGMLNGSMVSFLSINPFVVTLGTMTALRGAAYLFADGTTVLNQQIPSFEWIGNGDFLGLPWLIWIAAGVVLLSWFILKKTVLGLHIYAVGGNPQAARLTGIKVSFVLLFVYSISGFFSGLAGAMSSSRLYGANGNWGVGYELDAIAAVVLGGTSLMGGVGTIWGTVIGALIIGVMNNGLTILGLSSFWQYVAKGAVIVLAVILDKWRQKQAALN